jgi:ubiquinone/menaquinone biosynthesis C-methylase UbiE
VNIAHHDNEPGNMPGINPDFEDLYIDVRRLEKRVYSDCELMFLPDIDPSHIHYKEWQTRKHSSQRLINYLSKKDKRLNILEVGCGNGWLSSKLSAIKNTEVIGLDINHIEIRQAQRVFKKDNLEFVCDGFSPELFDGIKFDVILFAASIQYFPSVKNILQNTFKCLTANGEIHIMDTPFYDPDDINSAMIRAKEYFTMLDCPEMAAYYFYHSLSMLKPFNYRILANPGGIINRISKKDAFYWISVTN